MEGVVNKQILLRTTQYRKTWKAISSEEEEDDDEEGFKKGFDKGTYAYNLKQLHIIIKMDLENLTQYILKLLGGTE